MRQWASVRAARSLWKQFRDDALHLPRRVWRQWLAILIIGALLVATLSFLAVWIVRPLVEAGTLQVWDEAGLLWVANATPLTFSQAMIAAAPGDILIQLPLVLAAVTIALRRHAAVTAATMLAGYSISTGLLWVAWSLWSRPRPDLIADGIAAPGFHAFPSGHMFVSVPVYGFFCYLWCSQTHSLAERAVAIGLTTLLLGAMASARLVIGAHWPTDIIAGVLLGLVWLAVQIIAFRRAASFQCDVRRTELEISS